MELFPPGHRRAFAMRGRQRIVEIGGGRGAHSCVSVLVARPLVRQQGGLRETGPRSWRAWNPRRKRTPACLSWGRPKNVGTPISVLTSRSAALRTFTFERGTRDQDAAAETATARVTLWQDGTDTRDDPYPVTPRTPTPEAAKSNHRATRPDSRLMFSLPTTPCMLLPNAALQRHAG